MNELFHATDDYLAAGLLVCAKCSQRFKPAPNVDGSRSYSCGPGCPQPDVPAVPLEQDLLLPALIRAYHVLHSRPVEHPTDDEEAAPGIWVTFKGPTPWRLEGTPSAAAEELRRWQQTDLSDRRAMLRTAYYRVVVEIDGTIQRYWRHEGDEPGAAAC